MSRQAGQWFLRTLSRLYTGAQKSMSMRLIILLRCGHFLQPWIRFGVSPYVDDRWVMQPNDLPATARSFGDFVESVLSAERHPSDDLKADAKARAVAGTEP